MAPRRDDDDGYGQVDGDFAGPASFEQFHAGSAGQPWLRPGLPPWMRWGSTERLLVPFVSTNQRSATVTLSRVTYKRPDTFHFFFGARLLDAPSPAVGDHATIDAAFTLLVGVGSTVVQIPAFERLVFDWIGPAAPPLNVLLWSTQVNAPNRNNGFPASNLCNQIVAQDITVQCDCTNYFGPTAATLEVTAFLSPNAHVRPDWFANGPPEVMFTGGEDGGR